MKINKARFSKAVTFISLLVTTTCINASSSDKPRNSTYLEKLKLENFTLLNTQLNNLIQEYENDPSRERELDLAIDEFYRDDPRLEEQLTKWIDIAPSSPAAYLARGVYYSKVGWGKRGSKYYNETTKEQVDGVQFYFEKSFYDLEKAKSLDGKLVHVLCYEIEILMNFGAKEKIRRLRDEALTINPLSLTARWYYISSILPRWGGSIVQVEQEIASAKPYYEKNPALNILDGRVSAELGDQALLSRNYTQALQYYSKAISFGEHWYYNNQRGEAASNLNQYIKSNDDFTAAIKLRPNYSRAYFMRGYNYYKLGNLNSAIKDFTQALSSTAEDPSIWDYRGDSYLRNGEAQNALEDFMKAVKLAPTNVTYFNDMEKAKALLAK